MLEKQRIEDFKKVLTYHLITKIHFFFKDDYKSYYDAPTNWVKWKKHLLDYDKKIYKLIILFNQTSLSKHQCLHIFGKDNGKYLPYSSLIASDKSIKVFNKGTIYIKNRRFGVKKRYQLPIEFIQAIFDDKKLLEKVCDENSDYYTARQKRLICTQIIKKNKYSHYKTQNQLEKEEKERIENISEQEKINDLMNDKSIVWD